jgi:soluble lytic murein transglycosylase-like protein
MVRIPDMRQRLQLALMASIVIATSLFLTPSVQAETESSASITSTTDDSGHKVYVNDVTPVRKQAETAPGPRRSGLEYWSTKERRWKPVPPANAALMRAARSAAAEVNEYLAEPTARAAESFSPFRGQSFSSEQIDSAIEQAAAKHNVDANLVRSVIKVESNFNPNAVSRKGAMGLMQLMPSTARQLNVTNPFDPEQNVDAGVRHLKKLLENYGGDVKLTLAAYNAGAGAVARSAGIPRYSETRNYVRRITDLYYRGSDGGLRLFAPRHDPIRVERDARGVLYISNTD